MACMLCGANFSDGDSVAKIVRAIIIGSEESLRYDSGGSTEERVVHIGCLSELARYSDKSKPAIHNSPVERNNILEFLGDCQ